MKDIVFDKSPKLIKDIDYFRLKYDRIYDLELIDEAISVGKCPPVIEFELKVDLLPLFRKYINYDLILIKNTEKIEKELGKIIPDKVGAIKEHCNDRAALVSIYNAANGQGWHKTWNLSEPFAKWHGVKTEIKYCLAFISNERRILIPVVRVVELDLSYNKLSNIRGDGKTGHLSAQVGKLTELKKLYLNNNDLRGRIPSTIGYLTKLTDLRLQKNQFSGLVPTVIGNLKNLTRLQLDHNRLEGTIPATFANLKNVRTLCLHNNNLDSQCLRNGQILNIPSEFANMPNLEEFMVYGNQLFGALPEVLKQNPNYANWKLNPQQNFFGFDKNLCSIILTLPPHPVASSLSDA